MTAPPPHGGAGQDHRDAEPLAHAETEAENTEVRVGLAEVLGREAEHAVPEQERAAQGSHRGAPPVVQRKQHEQEDALEQELVQLRRVTQRVVHLLSLIHISEPTRRTPISYAV